MSLSNGDPNVQEGKGATRTICSYCSGFTAIVICFRAVDDANIAGSNLNAGAYIASTEKNGNALDGWQSNTSPRSHGSRMILVFR